MFFNMKSVELATNARDIASNWNIPTSMWLNEYFYQRSKQFGFWSVFLTNCVSAFWHGFYPGYYVTFISFGVMILTMRILYQKTKNYNSYCTRTRLWSLGKWLFTQIMLSYLAVSFLLLGASETFYFLRKIYFAPQVILVVLLGISFLIPHHRKSTKEHETGKEKKSH